MLNLNEAFKALGRVAANMFSEALLRRQNPTAADVLEEQVISELVEGAKLVIDTLPQIPFYARPFLKSDGLLRPLAKAMDDAVEGMINTGLIFIGK